MTEMPITTCDCAGAPKDQKVCDADTGTREEADVPLQHMHRLHESTWHRTAENNTSTQQQSFAATRGCMKK